MKRGLCCVCAVLVCTALVFAGSPVRTGVDQKTGDAALTVTPAQPQTTVSSLGNVSPSELWSNRVPAGAAAHVWTRRLRIAGRSCTRAKRAVSPP
jgi:hypothetical protein